MHVHGTIPDSVQLLRYLAHGVTTIRDMYTKFNEVDTPSLEAKRAVESGTLLGPRIYTAERLVPTYVPGAPDRTSLFPPQVPDSNSVKAAAPFVVALKQAGHDFIKVYDLPHPVYDSVAAAAQRVGLRMAGHVAATGQVGDVGLERVLQDRWASIEHGTGYFGYMTGGFPEVHPATRDDEGRLLAVLDTASWMRPGVQWDTAKLRRIAVATREAGVWNCPTLWVWYMQTDDSLGFRGGAGDRTGAAEAAQAAAAWKAGIAPRQWQWFVRWTDLMYQLVRALQDAGAGLLLGTDSFYSHVGRFDSGTWLGFQAAPDELWALVTKAGLTPYQALATGTRNVAAFLGTQDSTGTVAVGKRADLVLLNGNPLQDIRAAASQAGVMVGGRWLARAELDARLQGKD